MIETLTAERVVEKLNSFLERDTAAITNLFLNIRVNCNQEMLLHPTIQCASIKSRDDRPESESIGTVSFLGILNGLFGIYDSGSKAGWGPITANYDKEKRKIISFSVTQNND